MISLPINVKEKYYRSIILTTAEIGIENVTVRKAAAKLNMSEAALYRHFQGKEVLFNETYLFADSSSGTLSYTVFIARALPIKALIMFLFRYGKIC